MPESEARQEKASSPSGDPMEVSAPVDFSDRAKLAFTVVGVGASAGGIEALNRFFSTVSPTCGMAFVVIQHLAPDHQTLMAEILGRATNLPVHLIEDGMSVERNHVYVICPGHTVTLENGTLRLGPSVEQVGHRRPVDDFFRSLASRRRSPSPWCSRAWAPTEAREC